jgi:CRISPR-associated exonuclease Cas4
MSEAMEKQRLPPISASDLERHAYCPMSWQLAREGVDAQGEAVVEGKLQHAKIHDDMMAFSREAVAFRRSVTIWVWWFTVVLVFTLEGWLTRQLAHSDVDQGALARLLSLWALTTLMSGIVLVWLPWRQLLGWSIPDRSLEFEATGVEPVLNPPGFIGGWFEAGRTEASMLLASIVLGLHAIALVTVVDEENASFILIAVAFVWTGLASWRLQILLTTYHRAEVARVRAGLDRTADDVVYSDDEEGEGLLIDKTTGLRGRPDQIVIVDGEFIPVEQKTGKVPTKPYESHRMQVLAYLKLVEATTGRASPYGVLRYGEDAAFQVMWDQNARRDLEEAMTAVRTLLEEGGAKRNHERVGKCRNCSRRSACPERLDHSQASSSGY